MAAPEPAWKTRRRARSLRAAGSRERCRPDAAFTPPLSAGGNAGVSAEVQDGIYQIIHALTAGCNEALQRNLAYEKEHALMRTKCSDKAVWERYEAALETSQASRDVAEESDEGAAGRVATPTGKVRLGGERLIIFCDGSSS